MENREWTAKVLLIRARTVLILGEAYLDFTFFDESEIHGPRCSTCDIL